MITKNANFPLGCCILDLGFFRRQYGKHRVWPIFGNGRNILPMRAGYYSQRRGAKRRDVGGGTAEFGFSSAFTTLTAETSPDVLRGSATTLSEYSASYVFKAPCLTWGSASFRKMLVSSLKHRQLTPYLRSETYGKRSSEASRDSSTNCV